MGHILPFVRPQSKRFREPLAQSAEILFFTGVRYERQGDMDSARRTARSAALAQPTRRRGRSPQSRVERS